MKTDLFGNIPKVGDIIVFNPPNSSGLAYGECIGVSKAGCPKIINIKSFYSVSYPLEQKGYYSVKTNFVIK